MRITVHYFGPAADDAGLARETIDLPPGVVLSGLADLLCARHPALEHRRSHLRFAVNAEYAARDAHVRDGDEVAVIPPVAGG
jgi:molybdopterin converting factor subunit 1